MNRHQHHEWLRRSQQHAERIAARVLNTIYILAAIAFVAGWIYLSHTNA